MTAPERGANIVPAPDFDDDMVAFIAADELDLAQVESMGATVYPYEWEWPWRWGETGVLDGR